MFKEKRENLIDYSINAIQEFELAIKNIEKKDYKRYSESVKKNDGIN